MKRSIRNGISAKRPLDLQRVAKAISSPGIDPRKWFSAGTVGVLNENDGSFSTTDREAVFVDRLGAVVSVRLEPENKMVTARYAGITCGRAGFMLVPVRPGDEVIVAIPDGDYNSPAISVVAILSNETSKVPDDWNNDRVLFDLNVPLEIRAPAIKMRSSNLELNGRPVLLGSEGI